MKGTNAMSQKNNQINTITHYFYIINRMPSALFESLDDAENAANYQGSQNPVSYYRLDYNKVTGYEYITHVFTDWKDHT